MLLCVELKIWLFFLKEGKMEMIVAVSRVVFGCMIMSVKLLQYMSHIGMGITRRTALLHNLALVLAINIMLVIGYVDNVGAKPAPESFAPLVEKLMPAVVNISTTQKVKTGALGGGLPFMFQLPDDPRLDPFREFFEQFGPGSGLGQLQEQEIYSLGSGFIIDPAGYVVTNNHVIADAEEIKVILQDDTKLAAKIVGRDPKTDLALLKVDAGKDLPYVSFGDSDASRVGDWIIAIGNPFGLGGSVSAGIISARSRSINAGPFDDFIQTDAAINRGNSGGPMFNMQGEVIGINTAIFSPSGGNIGIGFAVPAAQAKPVLLQLKEYGRTYRGWLGVKIQHVTSEIAESVGLKHAMGALVLEINENSPASKSDIKPGDVILEFDGKKVSEMRKLPRIVAETKIGKKVEVIVWRDGKKHRTSVVLGELDESEEQLSSHTGGNMPYTNKEDSVSELLGMDLAVITPQLRRKLRLDDDSSGVVVLRVEPGSPAAKQNIRRGDIITRVNDKEILNIKDLRAALQALSDAGRNYALVRIIRQQQNLFVTLPTNLK